MTAEHPDAIAYRRTAEAFRAGDVAALEDLIDDGAVWHVPGRHRRAGDIQGREAVIAWLTEVITIGFRLREHDVFASDEHVCALSFMGAQRPGVDVETRVVSIFHYRDGRQVERWFYPENADAWDRIFEDGDSDAQVDDDRDP
jgi:ketosteroid isomerase-like protein